MMRKTLWDLMLKVRRDVILIVTESEDVGEENKSESEVDIEVAEGSGHGG